MKFKRSFLDLITSATFKIKTLFSNKQRGLLNIILIIIEALIIICIGYIGKQTRLSEANTQNFFDKKSDKLTANLSINSNNEAIKSNPVDAKKCKKLYMDNKNVLILVNFKHEIPDQYDANLKYLLNGKEQVSVLLYDDLVDMLRDAKTFGYSYLISSGYRDRQKQQELIDNQISMYLDEGKDQALAEKETYKTLAKPGYSEHHTGLAIDFLSSDNLNMDISQENTKGNIWLRSNSYKYGFILRYPKGKEGITYINYEPWHFRYVGKDVAKFIYDNNITFEEFYDYANK